MATTIIDKTKPNGKDTQTPVMPMNGYNMYVNNNGPSNSEMAVMIPDSTVLSIPS